MALFTKMFEEQYIELAEAVDVIAERIRSLGVLGSRFLYSFFLRELVLKKVLEMKKLR